MNSLAEEIIAGRRLGSREEALPLVEAELEALCRGADRIRSALCGSRADLCTIVNGRSGQCGEDCKFCAQSCLYRTQAEEYPFLAEDEILAACRRDEAAGARRFSIVTAGRSLKGEDLERALSAYRRLRRETGVELCASHGLQTQEEFERMKAAGVDRIHANLETSRRYFPTSAPPTPIRTRWTTSGGPRRRGWMCAPAGSWGWGRPGKTGSTWHWTWRRWGSAPSR